jgi:four helix bundle protein
MNNKEFGKILEKRTKDFVVNLLKLTIKLPDEPESKVIRYQLAKSGSSIGANYREANRARSKADFKNKISICESEASETEFWIEVVEELGWIESNELTEAKKEVSELLAIFSSIGKKTS